MLEANTGIIRDEEDFLRTLVEAQRIAIAQAEVSLEPVASLAGGGLGSGGMPGAGSAPSAPARGAASSGGAPGAAPSSSSSMSGM